ncbi:MAG TPA: bifunctional D-glycero-beta-D-manno-heptose-7-phosphate kinase/D-glycero-beta-D-manno-heptose 1-phosphate adenylyltransferase HldE [Acidobacteriaceae bacterium]|jgi:D-beta-D-heptose 7-phosphate kinase/D-beta-D-heptose 1-phosphate adenosyltransferase|nr:bifunctional D-glycero-beta-D-manno-heptose-7-phosphate kinase/D-glycero-beta-D-manno-heptose 1-phosphate adenylyltransferase HldE [Acidobacteriaceae bacterium]
MIGNLHRVLELIESEWDRAHVLVIGDVMLDKYLWGEVERISPEAPVPVVRTGHRSEQPGGAGNVAMNLAGLGSQVTLLGFAGGDSDQEALESLLRSAGIACRLIATAGAPTTAKLRILGGNQQMLRLDTESSGPRPAAAYDQILSAFEGALPSAGVVILSDYSKGVLSESLCRSLIQKARAASIPVLVDPKSRSFERYRGATTVCPNLNELALAAGLPTHDMEAVLSAGQAMIPALGLDYLTVTLSDKGIAVLYPDRRVLLPAVARKVFDVSGAGDTAIATLALGLAGRLPIEDASRLANLAAGIVVAKVGTVPVQKHELVGALSEEIGLHAGEKVLSREQLMARVAAWRAAGQRIVFTNGCFDILHIGHIALLSEARLQGDKLIVGINSDASVQRLKGPSRPMVPQNERAQMLAALTAVDSVVVFGEDTPLSLIEAVRPDVLVKGGDYTEATIVGASEVRSWGGAVRIIPVIEGISTSKIIAKAIASSPA